MKCIVIYDITSTRIRNKIADLCMDYGLNRIQYSAFAGDLLRTHQEELIKRAAAKLGKHAGRIYLYCIGDREWGQRLEYVGGSESATADA
ncbi:MAG: CRISPR-associated endonuclease Cas2 [Thermoflexales bacterium]|nr:CRISPR-associated endonuclease Cas2 [Thermoflexales bacterium]